MEIIFLLVPFLTSAVLQGVKKLAGLYSSGNPASQRSWLRMMLIVLSFFGIVATSVLNGTPIDANTVTDLVRTLLATVASAFLSHFMYKGMTRPTGI